MKSEESSVAVTGDVIFLFSRAEDETEEGD